MIRFAGGGEKRITFEQTNIQRPEKKQSLSLFIELMLKKKALH